MYKKKLPHYPQVFGQWVNNFTI